MTRGHEVRHRWGRSQLKWVFCRRNTLLKKPEIHPESSLIQPLPGQASSWILLAVSGQDLNSIIRHCECFPTLKNRLWSFYVFILKD